VEGRGGGRGGGREEGRGILRLFPPPFHTTTFVQQIHSMDKNKKNPPVLRIRVGSGFNQVSTSGSGSRREKITHKKWKKLRNFMF
jgi:hypothetical protein